MGWSRFFRRRFWDEERSRELQAHVAIETDANIARGMAPDEARYAAHRKFGNPALMREEIYHMNSVNFVETLGRDVRYGLRMLAKSPGFTAVAVLTLALGIGANTAIFSVVNAVLLRPLPYREPARLAVLQSNRPRLHIQNVPFSPADFVDYQAQNRSFEQIAAIREIKPNLTGKDVPAERIRAAVVTPNFFTMLGVSTALGRGFLAEDGVPGAPRMAILEYAFWQRHFGGAPGVLGSQITLNGADVTIVGVLPAQFIATVEADVWLNPRSVVPEFLFSDASDPRTMRGTRYLNIVIGRLKPGVSLAQAQSDMDGIAARLERENSPDEGFSVRVIGLRESLVADLRVVLMVLLCVVGMVLLIACGNVANLLLARAASRQREVAVRLALGAGRWRVARQLLTESLILALCGGMLGVLLATLGTKLFSALQTNFLPRTAVVQLDLPALLFTLAIALITGILFGTAPAIQNSRLPLSAVMGESGRGNSSGLRQGRLRSGLAAAQIAMSLVLLIAAGLLTRSFVRLLDVKPGFDPNHLVTMAINLTSARYAQQDEQRQFVNQLLARLQALPGVEGVGLSSDLPLERTDISTEAGSIEGQPLSPGERFVVGVHPVNPDYFRAMGVPLLRGRAFSTADVAKSRPVVILNQRSVEKLWPGQDAIGKHIQLEGNQAEVVGVVGNILHNGLNAGPSFESYLPYDQFPWSFLVLAVRTRADSGAMVAAARNAVGELDPSLPVYNVRPMSQVLEATLASRVLTLNIIGAFAVLALVLAMVGIYGVMSYAVTQRAHELGVRIALGASPGDVLRMVLGKGLRLAAVGMAVGLVASFVLTRLLRSLLFSVTSTDPATFAGVTVLLTGVVVLACYLPARRASRVDPIVTLRYD